MSESSALERLAEAASGPTPDSGDLDEFCEWHTAKSWLEDHQGEIVSAGQALAAALTEAGRKGYWSRATWHLAGFEAHTQAGYCTRRCIEARKALARWAKLGKEGERDG